MLLNTYYIFFVNMTWNVRITKDKKQGLGVSSFEVLTASKWTKAQAEFFFFWAKDLLLNEEC